MDDTIDAAQTDVARSEAVAMNRADRKRSLDALHQVEFSAATAAPGRAIDWVSDVRGALGALEDALAVQAQNSAVSDSPLSDIEVEEPRLRNRVVQLRQRYADLRQRVAELRSQLDAPAPESLDVADVRRRLEGLAGELRYQRAREADIIYEAYSVDLGAGD